MSVKGIIRQNAYYDSVTLMQISKAVEEHPQVQRAMVSMGTEMNKELLHAAGLLTEEFQAAKPSDLIIAFLASDDADFEGIYALIDDKLNQKAIEEKSEELPPTSIESAVRRHDNLNLAVVSLPGAYAAQEVKKALNRNLHVMLFSDNVTLAEEIALKKLAHEKGLLMMGPDCGTAVINGVGLCFANSLRRGSIGIVGASGTGTQEVSVLIDRLGGGVSQVLGTGGRDLMLEVGGIMMLDGMTALDQDPDTEVIVLISKPPVESVAEKIITLAKKNRKKTVICFINSPLREQEGNLYYVSTLEAAAMLAVELSTGKAPKELQEDFAWDQVKEKFLHARTKGQQYVRGLYCGGTVCDEAASLFGQVMPEMTYSNVGKVNRLEKGADSEGHCFLDLGDDEFTLGRPHPMIEPSLRNDKLIQEALKPETAIILFDVELGYGSHRNPAGEVLKAVRAAKEKLQVLGREVLFVAYVLGTADDLQGYDRQVKMLVNEGVIVAASNARAAKLCLELVGGIAE